MVKNEKFQFPSERGGPEDFKNHPTFVPSAILGGVMASQTWKHFLGGHPVEHAQHMAQYIRKDLKKTNADFLMA